jgi:preprotein translocase subunit SecD
MTVPKSLRRKWIAIAVVVLGCVFGVIELPKSTEELVANWNKNIRLGLDLKGGTHLVLQIEVQDAFKAEADTVMDRLKELLNRESIAYTSMDRNEPASIETADTIQINIRGIPTARTSDFRRLINEAAGQQWILSPTAEVDYRLNLRPEAAVKLRQDTLVQTISTMEK